MPNSLIVKKRWSYCNILRDEGMSYGDFDKQLTYLLFLKMVDECFWPPYNQVIPAPQPYARSSMINKDSNEQLDHYRYTFKA